jgi:general secretion pathway protein A
MFLNYYGLREEPFGVTPDPRFLYLTPSHREAQATLDYGIQSGRGFAALVARPGMGKTTLLFHLLQRYSESAKTAFLFQTQCDSREFMRYLLVELGLDMQVTDFVQLHDEFNRMMVRESRAGRRIIIVVDEAQNLSPTVLETVRLLSDFETPRTKLLHIILAGQPELADKLASPSLAQLRQRITHLVRLDAFSRQQTDEYIEHRLRTIVEKACHASSTTFVSTLCPWDSWRKRKRLTPPLRRKRRWTSISRRSIGRCAACGRHVRSAHPCTKITDTDMRPARSSPWRLPRSR